MRLGEILSLRWDQVDKRAGATTVSWNGESIKEVKTAWNAARTRADLPGLLRHDLRRAAVRNVDERDIQMDGARLAAYLEAKAKVATVEKTQNESGLVN